MQEQSTFLHDGVCVIRKVFVDGQSSIPYNNLWDIDALASILYICVYRKIDYSHNFDNSLV